MNRMLYEVDFINGKIILTKKFYKAASILNSPEYKTMLQLRTENPGFEGIMKMTLSDAKQQIQSYYCEA